MNKFYYVYILKSLKDKKHYAGYTQSLDLRFEQHQNGKVKSTKHRRPLMLIYFEGCLNKKDALKREKYFKTHAGKKYLITRLANWKKNDSPNLI